MPQEALEQYSVSIHYLTPHYLTPTELLFEIYSNRALSYLALIHLNYEIDVKSM